MALYACQVAQFGSLRKLHLTVQYAQRADADFKQLEQLGQLRNLALQARAGKYRGLMSFLAIRQL